MGSSQGLDEVDKTILNLLREDSRIGFQKMSRQMGISDATIQFRLKRMKANGIIDKFTVIVDPAALGYQVMAILLVQTDTDKHENAKTALARIHEVSEVYGVLGEYDLMVKLWSRSLVELRSIINEKIRSIEGIEDLVEIVVAERVKEELPPL
jgi:Lrp/AsnC family transcriptional regulator, regulator for asnA, asnC and gidA